MEDKIIKNKLHNFSNLFSSFSNPWRIYILLLLYKYKKLCVNEIASKTGFQQAFISQNLQKLRAQNIVKYKRIKQKVFYELNENEILEKIIICLMKEIEPP